MDIQEEVEAIKRELVELIIKHLRENRIPVDKAKQLAKDFLNILPISDQQDLLNKLKNLGDSYGEAKEIYVRELTKASEQNRERALSQIRDHIKLGNINEAIKATQSLGGRRG